MVTKENVKTLDFNGEQIVFKTGKLAPRAESSVLVQLGETVVLTVVSMNKSDTDKDYFPLNVEYIEKFYAGGIISESRFVKRERRPSDEAVLKARQVDHSIRSLFPKSFKKDVDLIITVLAYDGVHDPSTLAVTSASMALMLSSIPFNGPSASLKIGVKDGEFLLNPSDEIKEHDLEGEFMISIRENRVLNIEGYGDEIPEEKMSELMDFAVEKVKPLLDIQVEFAKEAGKTKVEVAESAIPADLLEMVKKDFSDQIEAALYEPDKRNELMASIKSAILDSNDELNPQDVDGAVEYVARKIMREGVLKSEKRTSGRKLNEIRDLEIEVGVLPRVHGSALFRRGLTQCMSILTLGSTRLAQILEGFEGEEEKSFMHHYNGPSYSLGEAGRFNYFPGRREIGHGNIGENALRKMLPFEDKFPYTIRVVSEILSQKGSSSMAASCGTSLALMDAGVPIKAQVGGISVGLVTEDENESNFKLLVDIEDVEDFYGDMDFKVTGTTKGLTAIQLDNKLMGVPVTILKQAFMKSKEARLEILDAMNKIIDKPREKLSEFAPKAAVVKINPAKIGELIGPGGKMIKSIMEKAGGNVDIDIKDDGTVNITATEQARLDHAVRLVEGVVEEPVIGKTYEGIVDKVMPYGAFVDVSDAISGLVHVSEMSDKFVKDPTTIVKEGDKVRVKITKIENGKVSFTMKNLD